MNVRFFFFFLVLPEDENNMNLNNLILVVFVFSCVTFLSTKFVLVLAVSHDSRRHSHTQLKLTGNQRRFVFIF